jgi:hypothetical protein
MASVAVKATPVMLPPGRTTLCTRPIRSGAVTETKTIGIVGVAC